MTEFQLSDAVAAALKLARDQFEEFAAMDGPEVPTDPTNAMQVMLMRWQVDRFGIQPDERMALGVIEEMDETFASETAEEALDGLGDVCVYAGQLLIANRIAIAPVLDLARVMSAAGGTVQPLRGAGRLAHTVLKGSQKIRGMGDGNAYRAKLVEFVALCIAFAIDDVEIAHGLSARAAEVYRVVGAEVLERKIGHPGIPANLVSPAILEVPFTAIDEVHPTGLIDDKGRELVVIAPERTAIVGTLASAVDRLLVAEKLEGPGDFVVADELAKINAAAICPLCGGELRQSGVDGAVKCQREDCGVEFTGKEIAALGGGKLAPSELFDHSDSKGS